MDLSYLNNAELRRLASIEERAAEPCMEYYEELERRVSMSYKTLNEIIYDALEINTLSDVLQDEIAENININVRHQIEKLIEVRQQEIDAIRNTVNWTSDEDLSFSKRNMVWERIKEIRGMELVADSLGLEVWEEYQPNV